MGVTPSCQFLEQILLLINQSNNFRTAISIGMSESDIALKKNKILETVYFFNFPCKIVPPLCFCFLRVFSSGLTFSLTSSWISWISVSQQ